MGSFASPVSRHLIDARSAALENPRIYPQVMPPILGLVSNNPALEMKRWAADFFLEALSSPTLASEEKQKMAIPVLPILQQLLEAPDQDTQVLKSTIQTAANVYPLVFRYM